MKILSGFLAVVCLFFLITMPIYDYYIRYQYERDIGSYFDNARDCITPECILEQLNSGRQAMVDNKLTEDLYGAWIFKKPDNSMKFQYQHLDGIIERAEAVAIWKNQTQTSGQIETMRDVYNEKMDNLRNYIHQGGRSDWIAKDAWYLKYHFILAVFWIWIWILFGILFLVLAFYCIKSFD